MKTEYWKNATPEQINLWNIASALIAWNTITPIYYCDVIAASEFTVYNAAKLYIALELEVGSKLDGTGNESTIYLYNMADALMFYTRNIDAYWDGTAAAARYCYNTIFLKNHYFSRLQMLFTPTYMKFNGYRLTTV